ncbi:hypothetical protein B566_EDAN005520 [Ephemera danica]|nr:hypothetical protein B566_EDAN005520 [Ephemera danica]
MSLLSANLRGEQLLELFLPFGSVKNIVLVPGKSSSFVEFSEDNFALEAYKTLHCTTIPEVKTGELFLMFAPDVPPLTTENTLQQLPAGLQFISDFVSKDEETSLLDSIDWSISDPRAGQALKHRKVRHYGYQFDYNTNNIDPNDPLPEKFPAPCEALFDKLAHLIPWRPNQITVNQYQPGQGIPPHVDTHSAFEDPILSLSLGADVVMEFRRDGQVVPVFLPRRSLLVMGGEARYCWSHGITPRKSDVTSTDGGVTLQHRGVRTSFTLRKLHSGPCTCSYPQHCDSQKSPDLEQSAARLEDLHVHQVYEQIAPHFSDTRHKPWPQVQEFVQSQPLGCVLFDVGCGNGKYLGLNSSAYQVGCDSSSQLLKVCRSRGQEAMACNCLQLPERRLRALQEMCRILKPGGRALIYVWARDQERGKVKSSYLRQGAGQAPETQVPPSPFSLPVHTNRTPFSHPDMLVPWKLKSSQGQETKTTPSKEVFFRFYHVFEEGELEELCQQVPEFLVTRSYYDQGNWCVALEKLTK